MSLGLSNVDALSDDEATDGNRNCQLGVGHQLVPKRHRRPAKRRHVQPHALVKARPNVQQLRHKVEGSCGCQCDCFKPFRAMSSFDQLVNFRTQMSLLDKLDQDNFVLPLGASQPSG